MTVRYAVTEHFLPHVTMDPSSSNAHSPSSSAAWSSCSVTVHWSSLPENNPQLISLPRVRSEVSPTRGLRVLTGIRMHGSKSWKIPFANLSASLFPSLGIHSTDARMLIFFI